MEAFRGGSTCQKKQERRGRIEVVVGSKSSMVADETMLGCTTRSHDEDTTTHLKRNTKGVVGSKCSVVADSASSGSSDGNSNIGDNTATKEKLTKNCA